MIKYETINGTLCRMVEPEPKESPIDPIERPLRNLILEAKEKGVNIRTWYQDLIFTPESLASYLGNGKYRWWNIGNWELTKRKANMPMPEPEPEPEYKVRDWVEIEVSGVLSQQQATSGAFADSIKCGGVEFYANGNPVMQPLNARIIRKLAPSEVRVKVVLEGTVKPCSVNTFELCTNEGSYWIGWKELDLDTAELVKALLKAQEEK